MGIINFIFRRKPKYAIKLKNANAYVSEKNLYRTTCAVMTTSIYNAKDFKSWREVLEVLDVIDNKRELYAVVVN